jgi:EAL domain-containing protein (putative c-di-GMP-specific phosphodiesterase class I)
MPVAEAFGLTSPIGRWALAEASREARAWSASNGRAQPPTVSLDVASGHFHHPDFVADVAGALDLAGLSGEALRLELTEAIVVEGLEESRATLEALHALGVRITIDDFGAGYASLGYLQRLPVDTIKLDPALTAALEVGEADRAIVQATTSLVRAFGMRAAAKGIETPGQLAWAHALGCERGQGNFFSGPLNGQRVAELLDGAGRAGDRSSATMLIWDAMPAGRDPRAR